MMIMIMIITITIICKMNSVSNDYNDHYIGINHIMLILTMMLHMFCMLNYLKTFSTFMVYTNVMMAIHDVNILSSISVYKAKEIRRQK